MTNITLSASILSADFSALGDAIRQCEAANCEWIHVDVMDGHFVPNISMGPFVVETCRRITQLPLDVHLMIDAPELFVEKFFDAGASHLTIHIENNQNVMRTLQLIRSLGALPGIAINPGTPASALEAVMPFVDLVLVMTVNPGFSGQKFMPEMVQKIADIKALIAKQNHPIYLEIDGGITAETILPCIKAGADTIVAATSIFKYPQGIAAGIQSLRQAVK
jgi:ribulose-phosphate 3-epimerase